MWGRGDRFAVRARGPLTTGLVGRGCSPLVRSAGGCSVPVRSAGGRQRRPAERVVVSSGIVSQGAGLAARAAMPDAAITRSFSFRGLERVVCSTGEGSPMATPSPRRHWCPRWMPGTSQPQLVLLCPGLAGTPSFVRRDPNLVNEGGHVNVRDLSRGRCQRPAAVLRPAVDLRPAQTAEDLRLLQM